MIKRSITFELISDLTEHLGSRIPAKVITPKLLQHLGYRNITPLLELNTNLNKVVVQGYTEQPEIYVVKNPQEHTTFHAEDEYLHKHYLLDDHDLYKKVLEVMSTRDGYYHTPNKWQKLTGETYERIAVVLKFLDYLGIIELDQNTKSERIEYYKHLALWIPFKQWIKETYNTKDGDIYYDD